MDGHVGHSPVTGTSASSRLPCVPDLGRAMASPAVMVQTHPSCESWGQSSPGCVTKEGGEMLQGQSLQAPPSSPAPCSLPLDDQLRAPSVGSGWPVYDLGLGKFSISQSRQRGPLPLTSRAHWAENHHYHWPCGGRSVALASLAAPAFETEGAGGPSGRAGSWGPPVGFRLQQGAGGEWTVPPARPQEEILSIKQLLTN